ncbi:MAG: FeoB small GTPase domain-containing protein, partial [Firmicutes bacterium]|nr:FeoB small GTPase domain-containing protein [Bacillota bacterium]
MQGLLPKKNDGGRVIALAGNPNVGKSTIFNALTGMHQHTGNWPGKTVALASGAYSFRGQRYILTDLPGTYSLLSRSPEEEVAAAFVRSGQADCVVVICDGTCLERTLLLALQIMELTDRVVLCVNLMDEVARRGVEIDALCLEHQLGIPVVTTSLGDGEALERLKETVREVCDGFLCPHPVCTLAPGADFMGAVGAESDRIAVKFVRRAEALASSAASGGGICRRDARLDRIFAGKFTGYPILLLLLFGIFWLTIQGANYPSALLQSGFDRLLLLLRRLMQHAPWWLSGVLLDGVFATTGRVVSVMLPPMAIFFP